MESIICLLSRLTFFCIKKLKSLVCGRGRGRGNGGLAFTATIITFWVGFSDPDAGTEVYNVAK